MRLHSLAKKRLAAPAAVFILSLGFFSVELQTPQKLNFDEFHYVPLARSSLAGDFARLGQHPPLALFIIAIGIAVFGDHPLGWRIMSCVAGAATCTAFFCLGRRVLGSLSGGLWFAVMSVFTNLLYVQARIAMLDTFMMAFIAWGMVALFAVFQPEATALQRRWAATALGAAVGCATACKWAGLGLFAAAAAALTCVGIHAPPHDDHPEGAAVVPQRRPGWRTWILAGVLLPAALYAAAFAPYVSARGGGAAELITAQTQLYQQQLQVTHGHPYASEWYSWPLILRPIWYAFESDPARPEMVRSVLLVGNPVVMWGGLVALLVCCWRALHRRDGEALLAVILYMAFLLPWAVIPRKVAFYYYYYPAAMTLVLAWGIALRELPRVRAWVAVLSGVLFVYFLPVLSGMPLPRTWFHAWVWFDRWV